MDPITALNAINGAAQLVNHNNDAQRQQNYQLELMDRQYQYNSQAMNQQLQAEKEMYDYTGYQSKVDQLNQAGLNPGLVYGMGGGGGGVTGSITAPQVGQGSAPNVSASTSNKIAEQGMMLQLAKLKSEIAVNEAQANQMNADASAKNELPAKTKAETGLLGEQTLGQSIENKLNEINLEIQQSGKFKNMEKIASLADQAKVDLENKIQDLIKNKTENQVNIQLVDSKVKKFNAELNKIITDTMTSSSQNELNKQKWRESANDIAQKWIDKQLTVEQMKTLIQKTAMETGTQLDISELNNLTKIFTSLMQIK